NALKEQERIEEAAQLEGTGRLVDGRGRHDLGETDLETLLVSPVAEAERSEVELDVPDQLEARQERVFEAREDVVDHPEQRLVLAGAIASHRPEEARPQAAPRRPDERVGGILARVEEREAPDLPIRSEHEFHPDPRHVGVELEELGETAIDVL